MHAAPRATIRKHVELYGFDAGLLESDAVRIAAWKRDLLVIEGNFVGAPQSIDLVINGSGLKANAGAVIRVWGGDRARNKSRRLLQVNRIR